jgi:alpha-L-fucosidase
MKRIFLLLMVILLLCNLQPSYSQKPLSDSARMAWWKEARFGMFIHWGIYSVPAGTYDGKKISGIGEWIMNKGKIPMVEYQKYAAQFNPVKYNAEEWVRLAKEAGMKYMVITSKHHDGFAMFKSDVSNFNIVDATPFKRDAIKELAAACKKYNMKLGLYYSQAQDWNHPGGAANGGQWDPMQKGSMDEYLDKVAVPQIKEILTKYGPISVLWFDTPTDMNKERAEKILPLLKLQPNIIINNRLGGGYSGDLETPEQSIPSTGIPGKNWESCMTMNDTWGFKSYDNNWKSTTTLLRNLIDIASKGGNYLLNVGPTSEGLIPDSSVVRLKAVGKWLKTNGQSVYGTSPSPFPYLKWGRCTRKGQTLYLHVFEWPVSGQLIVPLENKVVKAIMLANPKQVLKSATTNGHLVIEVPKEAPDNIATVIAIQIVGEPTAEAAPSKGLKGNASTFEPGFEPSKAFDGNLGTRWKAAQNEKTGWLEADFGKPVKICAVAVQEGGSFEKNISKYQFEYKDGTEWKVIFTGKTIGQGFMKAFPTVEAQQFRLNVTESKATPFITDMQLYKDM